MASKIPHLLFKLAGAALLLASFIGGWLVMDYRQFVDNPLPVTGSGYRLVIAPGTSLSHIAATLSRDGVLPHPFYLKWLARLHRQAQSIQAGEYLFEPGTTPRQLLEQVVTGVVMQHTLTIVEGWTFKQLLEALQGQDAIDHTLKGLDGNEIMEHLGHPGEYPEGRFMPDTYRFPRGTTDLAFLQRAYQAMAAHLDQEWQRRDPDLPYQSPYDALIMASIIEKETGLTEERPQVAGVFVRRLMRHMRLQTDPAVIYGLGAHYDGNLTRKDLATDSLYNTYMHPGLPPTPIALPGAASIHAALHPAPGDTLFFVSRGDGSHVFSSTLADHNKAVRRFQIDANRVVVKGRANTSP